MKQKHSALTGWCCELQCAEADVVESLVVEDHALVRVLNKLVNGERGVVRLHDSVRHLGRREDGEGQHHAVRVLLPDLGDEQGAHAGARASSQRVADLEPCSERQGGMHNITGCRSSAARHGISVHSHIGLYKERQRISCSIRPA
jgi:hypothetical protein